VNEALLVSHVALWIVVVVLAVVVFALMRQIGVLHERVSPAGALMSGRGPRVGEVAPVLDVEEWSGRRIAIGGREPEGRSTLLFFLSPSCPVCKALLPVLESVARDEDRDLRVLYASDGPREEHIAFVERERLADRGYILSTELGLAFAIGRLPTAVLLDAEGVIRAQGLVNSREHLESLFEARARGVSSLQEWLGAEDEPRRVA
jgi:methylamine dehydrogenase accessory protein MauD